MVQELYKVIDASELLTVKSELVALEVEVLQGLVLTQSLSELSSTLWPEEVALKLKLSMQETNPMRSRVIICWVR